MRLININFKRFKLEHFAFIFLAFGLIVLYLLSLASKPVYINDYSELNEFEGETVLVDGIIVDIDTTSRNEGILTVLEPDDLESTLKIFVENNGRNFSIGDVIQAKGSVLKINEDFYELIVVNDKDIKITGHWHNYKLSIPDLAHRLEQQPAEFRYLPVEISGYIKYEPRKPITSIRLSEDPGNGMYTVKVEVNDPSLMGQVGEDLHKGDLVSLNVSVEYNENNFEYKLIMKNITLLKQYGEWCVTLPELQDAPFIFEGATINTSGYVYEYEPYYNYVLLQDSPGNGRTQSNCSIWVDISELNLTNVQLDDDYFISLKGALYYDPQYFDYAIKTEELFLATVSK